MSRQSHLPLSAAGTPAPLPCELALTLLERSIGFGHGQLAVIRLVTAVLAGAEPSEKQWRYCTEVVQGCGDIALRALLHQAAVQAEQRSGGGEPRVGQRPFRP